MSFITHPNVALGAEVRRLTTLYELLLALTHAKAIEDVYQAAVNSVLTATAADRAAILTFDSDGIMRFEAWRDLSPEYRQAVTGHTPWQQGTQDAQPLVIPDVLEDETLGPYHETFAREHIRALAFVPLSLGTGVIGKFMLYYADPHECTEEELAIAQVIASHVSLVIERRRAEVALRQSERRLESILDNSATVIFLKDVAGRYRLVNRCFEDLFHMRERDIIGKTDREIFPAEIAERFRENDRKVLETRQPITVEEQAPQDDGMHTFISTKFPIEDPDQGIVGVCGIATDITARKQLEAASLHLAAIVENSEDAIVGKDLNGIITSWNRGAERIFGYTAHEAVGNPVSMLAAPDRTNEMPHILHKIRKGERVEHYETLRRRKDGEAIHVSLTVSPVRDASGRIIGASKIARDISDRKRAETERALLLGREQEARRTAELLNRVSPMLAAGLDRDKLVQSVTDVATELVGAEFGSFFHQVVDEQGDSCLLYTSSGVAQDALAHSPLPRNPAIFGPIFRSQGVVRSDDVTRDSPYGGNPRSGMAEEHGPVRSYLAAPVVSRSGEVLGGLFFGHSAPGKFTEQHEAIVRGLAAQAAIAMDNARLFEQAQWVQNELKRSNEELRRANHDLETFAYSASHDLQEPLRTMAISAQLLERRYEKQPEGDARELLGIVVHGAQRMQNLIRDILPTRAQRSMQKGRRPASIRGKCLRPFSKT